MKYNLNIINILVQYNSYKNKIEDQYKRKKDQIKELVKFRMQHKMK